MSSSNNNVQRRHVQARRRQGNPPSSTLDFLQVQGNSPDNYRRGNKRNFQQIQTPPCSRKNIANDRMKRLRDSFSNKTSTTQNHNNRVLRSPNPHVNHGQSRPQTAQPVKQSTLTIPNRNNNRRRSPTKVSPLAMRLERVRRGSVAKRDLGRERNNKRRAKDGADTDSSAIKKPNSDAPIKEPPVTEKPFVPTNFVPSSTFNFGPSSAPTLQQTAASQSAPSDLVGTITGTCTLTDDKMEWDTNSDYKRVEGGSSSKNVPEESETRFNVSRASLNWAELTESAPMQINCDVYIVVDTNIFISHIQLIRTIMEINITASGTTPIIYIPWIVLEELDYLKSGSDMNDVKWKAQDAVKFINRALQNKNDRIIGQTVDEVLQQRDTGIKQDDKILACCLQIKENRKNIILLSNDINLKNKALINNIQTCSHYEIINKINRTFKKASKSDQILGLMTILCSNVIKKCALKTYGDNWDKLHMLQTPPQSISDCIRVFKKYWMSLFQEVLMKQFQKAMIDLSTFLSQNKDIENNREALNRLTTLCVRICLFLKDVGLDRNLVENTIRDINEIKDL